MADDQERRIAVDIERSHPNWVVLWGCYSRLFWAFPYFPVPQGTIVSAPGQDSLLADMHSVELEVRANQQVAAYGTQQAGAYSSPPSPTQLPRRLSRGQAQRGALPRVAPATDALAVASRQEQMSGPWLAPDPHAPAPSERGTVAAAMPWPPRAGAQPARKSHDPYAADPYELDPYSSDPYELDPFAGDHYELGPYAADPYAADPYNSEPYDSEPYEAKSAWPSP